MDYKEKYDELVEAARAVVEGNPGLCNIDEGLGRLRKLLPEKESEDERIKRFILTSLNYLIGIENSPGSDYDKQLKEAYSWIEKQKEQKPAGWSEEDEKYLNIAINIVSSDFGEDSPTVSWLKSLHPQPHWKPSEEQMEALKYALGEGGKFDKAALESLYDELIKQLKKETL